MKGPVVALVAGIAIGSTGVAGATLSGRLGNSIVGYQLKPGVAYGYGAFTCTTYDATTTVDRTLVCLRNDLKGLTLAFNSKQVVGARVNPVTHKVAKVVFRLPNR
ncbi:MAG: hypothetical protein JWM06_3515 [Actinomycetia bacterium]|jgi:hypothetical protein|nr:hypothetical protein [Actinomycetes bacterium]